MTTAGIVEQSFNNVLGQYFESRREPAALLGIAKPETEAANRS